MTGKPASANLRAVDLNLLVALDALLDEAHVSRAAVRLELSQPATSNALARCRHLFGDPLLERVGGQMQLTAVARDLREPLKRFLAQVAEVIHLPEVDLATVRRAIRFTTADFIGERLITRLASALPRTAPGIDLIFQPYNGMDATLEALASGTLDLAISVFPELGDAFQRRLVLQDRWQVLMRKGHPALTGFDLDRWLAYPHILTAGAASGRAPLDERLAALGRSRRIGMIAPGFLMAPALLAGSDLIATLPSRCLPEDLSPFAVLDPPIELPSIPLHLAWHIRRDSDRVVQHIRGLVETIEL